MGIINKAKMNILMILTEAKIPNSRSKLLFTKTKVAKPDAVVMLVIKVAFPIFEITRCSAFACCPCFFISCWYLLIRKTAFGTPITIINGGIKADKTVIS